MFDLRYHVASLAAVFLALIIGILVGVGLSDRGLVGKAEKDLYEHRIAGLQNRLHQISQQAANQAREQDAARTYIARSYPRLMRDRLRGMRIAVVFVGSVDRRVRASVQQALTDAGAQAPVRLRALKVPIDVPAIDTALASHPDLAAYVGDKQLSRLGRDLGKEFMAGGDAPLWDALAEQLVEERSGGKQRSADGVVVARSAPIQYDGTARFLRGFYLGLGSSSVPVVGVEVSDAARSMTD